MDHQKPIHHSPAVVASATPSPEGSEADPIAQLTSKPAPLVNFDGEIYFLIASQEKNGLKVLEFVRDGGKMARSRRNVVVRFQPAHTLRSYEKAFLAKFPGAVRTVRYRSSTRLSHSIEFAGPEGATFVLMEWRLHPGGLVCCEFTLHQNAETAPQATVTPSAVAKTPHAHPIQATSPEDRSFQAVLKAGMARWEKDLITIYGQSGTLLNEPAEPPIKVPVLPTASPTPRRT